MILRTTVSSVQKNRGPTSPQCEAPAMRCELAGLLFSGGVVNVVGGLERLSQSPLTMIKDQEVGGTPNKVHQACADLFWVN